MDARGMPSSWWILARWKKLLGPCRIKGEVRGRSSKSRDFGLMASRKPVAFRRTRGSRGPRSLGLARRSFLDGLFGQDCLLADPIGNFRRVALVDADDRQILGLADEVERPKRFPNLFDAGVNRGDFGPCRHACSLRYRKSLNAPADG